MEKILFSEEQRFNQWTIWLLLIVVSSATVVPLFMGIRSQLVLDGASANDPMSAGGLIVTGVFSVLMILFIFLVLARIRLRTKITIEALYVSYYPLARKWKKFVPDEIEKFQIRTYRAKREYGGYGMKRRRRSGQAYTISGKEGLQLYLKNGKKILIGTQKKQAIEYAMRKLMEGEE